MRTLEGFSRRVWLFVAVVLAYVLLLQGLHVVSQAQATTRLAAEVTARARLSALAVMDHGGEALRQSLREWSRSGVARRPSMPRAFFEQHGIMAIDILTPQGWGIHARIGADEDDAAKARVDDRRRRRLEAGEVLVDLSGAEGDPVYAVATAWQPILDTDARLLGILEIEVTAEALALARRRLLAGIAIEGGSLLLFAGLLTFFMRWTLRPLQLLARTAGAAAGDETMAIDLARRDETGFVIETYRRMIEQLREKEQELRRLREVERHRADALQELNASIVDSMVSGVLILDLSGNVRSMNEVARTILGLADERITGRPLAEVLRLLPELQGRVRACLDQGAVVARDEIRLGIPGIGRRDVGLTISPLKDAAGARTGVLCLMVDLTEIKRLQEEVRLKESLAELGELSAGIAHEFRNALAAIMGFAQLLERRAVGEAREHAAAISAECSQLRRVVDDFLRFANPTRLVVENVDLARVFADLAEDVQARGADKHVRYDVDAGLPVITGDDTLLRRAFGNLLRNAADAVGPRGRVHVSATPGDREITIHVDDDGPGIPVEDRHRVFVPFFTRKDAGTGLGLALVRKIALHHGGRVAVEESPLGGARMSLSLPLRPDREAIVPPPDSGAAFMDRSR